MGNKADKGTHAAQVGKVVSMTAEEKAARRAEQLRTREAARQQATGGQGRTQNVVRGNARVGAQHDTYVGDVEIR